MEDISNEIDNLVQYEDAIINSNTIKITYCTEKKSEDIKINPIKIVNFEGFWYIVATDVNNKLKSYRIKNCQLLKIYKTTFKIPKTVEAILNNAISIWFSDNKPFKVTLQIDNHVARFFKDKPISATQKIISEDDKYLVVSVMATSDWEIIPIVKSYIPFIKVLSPVRIQETVVEEARKFISL
ncbi:MAG: WYL domain-containing protein [Campylobacterota bacterium]|nr:WYL domain-containing protein [Campylobacterota bacterium]